MDNKFKKSNNSISNTIKHMSRAKFIATFKIQNNLFALTNDTHPWTFNGYQSDDSRVLIKFMHEKINSYKTSSHTSPAVE